MTHETPTIESLDRMVTKILEKGKELNMVDFAHLICNIEKEEEIFDCPIHGKLGGIDECPKC